MRYLSTALLAVFTPLVSAQCRHPELFEAVEPTLSFADTIACSWDEIQILMDSGAPGVSITVGVDGKLICTDRFGFSNKIYVSYPAVWAATKTCAVLTTILLTDNSI